MGRAMSVHLRTEARIYCDGGTHQGLEVSVAGDRPMPEVRAFIRRAGWTITRDGRTLCPEHARSRR